MAKQRSMTVCIHDMAGAVSALKTAREQGCLLILESPPRVAEIQGTAWFLALVDEAKAVVSGVAVQTLVDAGPACALAMDALERGADVVRIDAGMKSAGKLMDIAKAQGARIEIKRKPKR
ncbi:Fructose/tagatose bisphosphate aldolase (fragment) [Rhodospirillaceae bacterium LM-1]